MIGIDFETVGLTPKRGNLRLVQTANGKGTRVLDAWDLASGELDMILAARQRVAGPVLTASRARTGRQLGAA
jgi:ribonuclease D